MTRQAGVQVRWPQGLVMWGALGAFGVQAGPASEPPPVTPGLWEVQMLTLFDPDPQPGADHWPGLPAKPRARVYRICLDAPRARVPMSLPRLAPGTELVSDATSMQVRDGGHTPGSDAPTLEWLYRRLSEREFEGSQTSSVANGTEMTLQYRSVFVQPDCNGVPPSSMSKFGEP